MRKSESSSGDRAAFSVRFDSGFERLDRERRLVRSSGGPRGLLKTDGDYIK